MQAPLGHCRCKASLQAVCQDVLLSNPAVLTIQVAAPYMAVFAVRLLWLGLALACISAVAGQASVGASGRSTATNAPPSTAVPGVSNPTICADGDNRCNPALVQPTNDTEYTNCINSPRAPNCTSSTGSASIESGATAEEACPIDLILDQGITDAELERQVRQSCTTACQRLLSKYAVAAVHFCPSFNHETLAGGCLC